ncbi:unnamed protein product [Gulo gulo]|uniref:Uncharacterized protein n=1 Tax=Gulo gulo TaxID=48420 RepID=A0A9X9Q7N1_GULGU|nr:unnamed protein product [Gulo gulo]
MFAAYKQGSPEPKRAPTQLFLKLNVFVLEMTLNSV